MNTSHQDFEIADLQKRITVLENSIPNDATIKTTDNSTNDASTTKHGWLTKLTAPATGLINFIGIAYGETVATCKALFDATAPSTQAFGDAAVVGTASVAARRDHKHAMPTVSGTVYKAIANQSGSSNPVLTVLNNTDTRYLNGLTFTRVDAGIIGASKAGATALNTTVKLHCNNTTPASIIYTYDVNAGAITITKYNTGVPTDGFTNVSIEIEYFGA